MSPAAYTSQSAADSTSKTNHVHSQSADASAVRPKHVPRIPGEGKLPEKQLMHVKDIITAVNNSRLDSNISIGKLIEEGLSFLRSAQSYRDFGFRLDFAFHSYLMAYMISAQHAPKHRDAMDIKNKSSVRTAYKLLQNELDKEFESFKEIKQKIKEDNDRHKTQPICTMDTNALLGHEAVDKFILKKMAERGYSRQISFPKLPVSLAKYESIEYNKTQAPQESDAKSRDHKKDMKQKEKPFVSPKPHDLTGNPIKSSEKGSELNPEKPEPTTPDIIAARFQKLKNESSTWAGSSEIAKPQGPRGMPGAKPKIFMKTDLPSLPKAPDAIYSPARGTVSSESAQLPSSNLRGLFTRTGSRTGSISSLNGISYTSSQNTSGSASTAVSTNSHSQNPSITASTLSFSQNRATKSQSTMSKSSQPPSAHTAAPSPSHHRLPSVSSVLSASANSRFPFISALSSAPTHNRAGSDSEALSAAWTKVQSNFTYSSAAHSRLTSANDAQFRSHSSNSAPSIVPSRLTSVSNASDSPYSNVSPDNSASGSILSQSNGPSAMSSASASSVTSSNVHDSRATSSQNTSPIQPQIEVSAAPALKTPDLQLPDGNLLTPSQLAELMKTANILLIDVRSRDEYNEGHIMSKSNICIEPESLLRPDMSAENISETLILGPESEGELFERRDEFDLIVIYDSNSAEIPRIKTSDTTGQALQTLYQALTSFNYGKELKRTPRFLAGGVETWIDHLGKFSLAVTLATPVADERKGLVVSSPRLGDGGIFATDKARRRRSSRYLGQPLKREEIQKWESAVKADEDVVSSPMFPRTTEEFLRKYPEIKSDEPESMISPKPSPDMPLRLAPPPPPPRGSTLSYSASGVSSVSVGSSSRVLGSPSSISQAASIRPVPPSPNPQDQMFALPPQRPPPAVPRPSYTGLSQSIHSSDIQSSSRPGTRVGIRSNPILDIGPPRGPYYTGFVNPNVWCYANSLLQVLRASMGFSHEIIGFATNPLTWDVPQKACEKQKSPQLMLKMMANLFAWMHKGEHKVLMAKTLLEYSNHLCRKGGFDVQFGNHQQHDVTEFANFLMDQLDDETNRARDSDLPEIYEYNMKPNVPTLYGAIECWRKHMKRSDSLIDKYFRGITVEYIECVHCGDLDRKATMSASLQLYTSEVLAPRSEYSLNDLFNRAVQVEHNPERKCEKCNHAGARKWTCLGSHPRLLAIVLPRTIINNYGKQEKTLQRVTWDVNHLDISPYCIPKAERLLPPSDEFATDPLFSLSCAQYECYGIIVHSGALIESGHYYTYVRKQNGGPHTWLRCNDVNVDEVEIGSGSSKDIVQSVFKSGSVVPYLTFWRRKDFGPR